MLTFSFQFQTPSKGFRLELELENEDVICMDIILGQKFIQVYESVLPALGHREQIFLFCLLCSHECKQDKERLKHAIWPERNDVSDVLLAGVAHRTRRALRASNTLVNIESVTGFGYRLDFLKF